MAERTMTRRAALAAAAGALACAAMPVTAHAEGAADDGAAVASTFAQPYAAWPGYATTAAESLAPGAVPVKAPASSEQLWSHAFDGTLHASNVGLALRQVGQSTFAYGVAEDRLVKVDMASGELVASAELPGGAFGGESIAWADGVLLIPLQTGALAAYDEDLNQAWVSEAQTIAQKGASWLAASQVVSADGAAYVLYAKDAAGDSDGEGNRGGQRALLVAYSLVDGSVLWTRWLERAEADAAVARHDVAWDVRPSLFHTESGLLACDGGAQLELISTSGDALARQALPGGQEARGRMVRLPNGYFALGTDGGMCLLAAVNGDRVVVAAGDEGAGSIVPVRPAAVQDTAYFLAQESSGAMRLLACGMLEGSAGTLTVSEVKGSKELPLRAGEQPTSLLATVYGARAGEETVALYIGTDRNAVYTVRLESGDALSSASVGTVRQGNGNGSVGQMLADRSGALCLAAHDSHGRAALLALASNEAEAAATPVGGSEGLDTIGSALSGLQLPNGAGMGVGVLIFALGFGAYFAIRNRDGRTRTDEGLDEWRRHGGGNGAGGRDGGARS